MDSRNGICPGRRLKASREDGQKFNIEDELVFMAPPDRRRGSPFHSFRYFSCFEFMGN